MHADFTYFCCCSRKDCVHSNRFWKWRIFVMMIKLCFVQNSQILHVIRWLVVCPDITIFGWLGDKYPESTNQSWWQVFKCLLIYVHNDLQSQCNNFFILNACDLQCSRYPSISVQKQSALESESNILIQFSLCSWNSTLFCISLSHQRDCFSLLSTSGTVPL